MQNAEQLKIFGPIAKSTIYLAKIKKKKNIIQKIVLLFTKAFPFALYFNCQIIVISYFSSLRPDVSGLEQNAVLLEFVGKGDVCLHCVRQVKSSGKGRRRLTIFDGILSPSFRSTQKNWCSTSSFVSFCSVLCWNTCVRWHWQGNACREIIRHRICTEYSGCADNFARRRVLCVTYFGFNDNFHSGILSSVFWINVHYTL